MFRGSVLESSSRVRCPRRNSFFLNTSTFEDEAWTLSRYVGFRTSIDTESHLEEHNPQVSTLFTYLISANRWRSESHFDTSVERPDLRSVLVWCLRRWNVVTDSFKRDRVQSALKVVASLLVHVELNRVRFALLPNVIARRIDHLEQFFVRNLRSLI